jgi:hypothetical protein
MIDPAPWIFYCTEEDYPKFRDLLPERFPSAYEDFAAAIDQRIADEAGQVKIVKTYVGFDEFMAFCKEHGKTPDYEALVMCVFRGWGRYRR